MEILTNDGTLFGVRLKDIKPIRNLPMIIRYRSMIDEIVELPLREACKIFYDKNIKTIKCSANQKDIEKGEAWIIVEYIDLSDENKRIADLLGEIYDFRGKPELKLVIPVDSTMSVGDISYKMKSLALSFKKQKPLRIPKFNSLDEVKSYYGIESNSYINPEKYYIDLSTGVYYLSKEHYEKTINII